MRHDRIRIIILTNRNVTHWIDILTHFSYLCKTAFARTFLMSQQHSDTKPYLKPNATKVIFLLNEKHSTMNVILGESFPVNLARYSTNNRSIKRIVDKKVELKLINMGFSLYNSDLIKGLIYFFMYTV